MSSASPARVFRFDAVKRAPVLLAIKLLLLVRCDSELEGAVAPPLLDFEAEATVRVASS